MTQRHIGPDPNQQGMIMYLPHVTQRRSGSFSRSKNPRRQKRPMCHLAQPWAHGRLGMACRCYSVAPCCPFAWSRSRTSHQRRPQATCSWSESRVEREQAIYQRHTGQGKCKCRDYYVININFLFVGKHRKKPGVTPFRSPGVTLRFVQTTRQPKRVEPG